jgi:hypothetical protein
MLMKKDRKLPKFLDPAYVQAHSEGGSKRFEEQQASGSVANLER